MPQPTYQGQAPLRQIPESPTSGHIYDTSSKKEGGDDDVCYVRGRGRGDDTILDHSSPVFENTNIIIRIAAIPINIPNTILKKK